MATLIDPAVQDAEAQSAAAKKKTAQNVADPTIGAPKAADGSLVGGDGVPVDQPNGERTPTDLIDTAGAAIPPIPPADPATKAPVDFSSDGSAKPRFQDKTPGDIGGPVLPKDIPEIPAAGTMPTDLTPDARANLGGLFSSAAGRAGTDAEINEFANLFNNSSYDATSAAIKAKYGKQGATAGEPGGAGPGGAANVGGIDPANDLRSSTILPGNDPAIEQAKAGLAGATSAFDTFDRQKVVDSLMAKNGGPDVPDIAPADDLRAKVIDGSDDQRTKDFAGQVDSASKGLPTDVVGRSHTLRDDYLGKLGNTDVTAGPAISTDGSARLDRYGSMLDQSAAGLAGVDRNKMAMDLYQQFVDAQAPQDAADERRATQQAAATGGLRSGRLRTAYGDLALNKEKARNLTKRGLISDALDKSVQDQFNKTNTLSGLEGALANREAELRGEKRTDRGYATDVATGNVNRRASTLGAATAAGSSLAGTEADNAYKKLDTLGNLETTSRSANTARQGALRTERANQLGLSDRKRANFESNRSNANAGADAASADIGRRVSANTNLFDTVGGENRALRGETRGERGYQGGLEDQAFQRRLARYQTEQGAKNTRFNQGVGLLGAGESGNPADVIARLQDSGIDPSIIAQLAKSMGYGGGGGGGGGSGLDIGSLLQTLGPGVGQAVGHATDKPPLSPEQIRQILAGMQ